jgi:hypothetical protein
VSGDGAGDPDTVGVGVGVRLPDAATWRGRATTRASRSELAVTTPVSTFFITNLLSIVITALIIYLIHRQRAATLPFSRFAR